MAQISLESGTGLSTPLLIADPVATPGGSNDSTGELTEVDGETASIALEIQSLLGAVLFPRVTTAIMNDFTAVNGMIIYNLTAQAFYGYINGAWSPLAYIGPDIGLSQGANIVLTPNPITSSGTIALSTTLINLNSVQVGNITLSGSDINSTGSLVFGTNGSTTALTLDTSQNATFTGVVKLINNNSLILGSNATSGSGLQPYISIMENTGNYITMGPNYGSGNNLIASVSSTLPFQINSGTSLIFVTNGSTTALTLDTSQNATFSGSINVPLNINLTSSSNLNGLFSSTASSASGGVYFDASAGNLRFSGGSSGNNWSFYSSGSSQLFYIFNNPSATNTIGISNGSLILQSTGGASLISAPTSMSGNYAYLWPPAYPSNNGYILSSNTAGVMTWIANEETEGSPNVLAYFNSSSDLAPNTNVTVDSSGDIVTSGAFQSNGITSNGNVNVNANLQIGESSAGNTYTLYFDNGTLNNYIVYNSGNLEIASAGTLTTSTVGDTYFYTNSGGLALTLDTSQNATFNKSVTVEGYILAQFPIIFNAAGQGGLYSYYANNGTGGTYIEPNYGFIEFKGGTGANTWGVIDSNGYTCLQVTNVGSGGSVILNNGNVTVQNGNSVYLGGSTGFVGLNSPNVSISSYNITFPAAAPSNAGFLNVPNSGTANWVTGRAFYQSSTTQAISGSTQTAVQFNNPIYNYGGVITASGTGNSVFTNSTSATIYVHFIYNLFWAGISVGGYNFEAYMLIGSGTIQYAQSLITSSNNQIILAGSGIVELTAGESFSIYVNNNQSNTYNLDGSATNKVVTLQM